MLDGDTTYSLPQPTRTKNTEIRQIDSTIETGRLAVAEVIGESFCFNDIRRLSHLEKHRGNEALILTPLNEASGQKWETNSFSYGTNMALPWGYLRQHRRSGRAVVAARRL